jgi:hypothetical protein
MATNIIKLSHTLIPIPQVFSEVFNNNTIGENVVINLPQISTINSNKTLIAELDHNEITDYITECLKIVTTKHLVAVCYGETAIIVFLMVFINRRLLRHLICIDAITRFPPTSLLNSMLLNLVSKLEERLPFGLPFRHDTPLNTAGYLQRLRIPTLVVTTPYANLWQKQESNVLTRSLPLAWKLPETTLPWNESPTEFNQAWQNLTTTFSAIPAKCPQKKKS